MGMGMGVGRPSTCSSLLLYLKASFQIHSTSLGLASLCLAPDLSFKNLNSSCYKLHILLLERMYNLFAYLALSHVLIQPSFIVLWIQQVLMSTCFAPNTEQAILPLLFKCVCLSVSMYEIFLLVPICNCSFRYTCLFWWHNYPTFNNRTSEGHFSCWFHGPSLNPTEIN